MRAAVLYDVARMEVRDVPRVDPGPRDVRPARRRPWVSAAPTSTSSKGTATTTPIGAAAESRSPSIRRSSATRSSAMVDDVGRDVRGVAVGRSRRDRSGAQLRERAAGAALRVLRDRRLAPVRALPRARHHGPAGGLAETMVVPAVNVGAGRPPACASTEAVLTEPLACIVHAVDAAMRAHERATGSTAVRRRGRETVLVTGAGPAGLLFVQYLRHVLGFDGRAARERAGAGQAGARAGVRRRADRSAQRRPRRRGARAHARPPRRLGHRRVRRGAGAASICRA